MAECCVGIEGTCCVFVTGFLRFKSSSFYLVEQTTSNSYNHKVIDHLRYRLTFFATLLGCETCCFQRFVPFLLAAEVAAYSPELRALIAFSGRYRSPVALEPCVDGLPDLVRNFCPVHFFSDFCDFFKAISRDNLRLWLCIPAPTSALSVPTTGPVCRPYHRL